MKSMNVMFACADGGWVVGTSETSGGVQRPFRYSLDAGGIVTQRRDLATLVVNPGHWHLSAASAINDAGQIVGWGVYKGWPAAFVLIPAPACDPDFNGDGNVDQDDVAAIIDVIAGGGCP